MPAALLAVAALVLTAGCASVPDAGPVVAGAEVRPRAGEAPRSIPDNPRPGADPREIVQGFLRATDALDRFEVAGRYLTAERARRWNPGDRIVHAPGEDIAVTEDGGGTVVTVTADADADITEDGRYTDRPEVERAVVQQFRLEREAGGEWRIADLPDEILVSRTAAEFTLQPYSAYFPADEPREGEPVPLVPDVRWLPARSESATRMVDILIEGPSAPLYESVVRVGQGLRRTDRGVSVADGVATVDLADSYLADGFPTSPAGRLFAAQLQRSLRELPGIRDVRITVEGRPANQPEAPPATTEPLVAGRPYVLVRATDEDGAEPAGDAAASSYVGRPGEGGGTAVTPVPGLDVFAARIDRGLAVTPDGRTFAGVAADGATLVVQAGGEEPVEIPTGGSGLTTPSFDSQGWLWTASRTRPPGAGGEGPEGVTVLAVSPGGEVQAVPVPWGGSGPADVVALRVSREGARILVVSESPDGQVAVEVRGIDRGPSGRPGGLSTTGIRVLPGSVTEALDATWVTSTTVAVLGNGPGGTRIALSLVGGPSREIDAPPDAVTVASGQTEQRLVVGSGDGAVYQRLGTSWGPPSGPAWSPAF
ncbi:MAG: LpqB family beta-propeller domain-containing protein [Kineosporiaceae bacterium]